MKDSGEPNALHLILVEPDSFAICSQSRPTVWLCRGAGVALVQRLGEAEDGRQLRLTLDVAATGKEPSTSVTSAL